MLEDESFNSIVEESSIFVPICVYSVTLKGFPLLFVQFGEFLGDEVRLEEPLEVHEVVESDVLRDKAYVQFKKYCLIRNFNLLIASFL